MRYGLGPDKMPDNSVIRNGYLYLTAYNDEGIYKINLSNSTDVTLIPFGFTSAGKSQTGSGTCANYLFMFKAI